MVRTGPDIQEDQRPEVDDRQLVAEHRAFGLLRDEVVHHPEEARGQEEAHRVMAVPPLRHRVLHTREELHRARTEDRDRNAQVVDDMQHRNGDDEAQEEPVRHVDMLFLAVDERPEEDQKIGHPDDRQPQVHVPFRLGIFLGLRGPQKIAGGRQHDEQVVAPEHEPREVPAPKPRGAGALHDVERGTQKGVAAKGKDHGAGVKRPQPAKVHVSLRPFEIQHRKGQLKRDIDPHKEAHHAPERRRHHAEADDAVHVLGVIDRYFFVTYGPQRVQKQTRGDDHDDHRMDHVSHIAGIIRCNRRT